MRRLGRSFVMALLFFLPTTVSGSAEAVTAYPAQSPAQLPDATIWYLGHCGYAVQIEDHLLIFDYIELEEAESRERGLDEGFIDAAELNDLDVTVFVTHEHSVHLPHA
jgi:hypothetical protein